MPFDPIPNTRVRGGKLYLNLPIPADLRRHFPTSGGKVKTHIVEALGTGEYNEGRRLARIRGGDWERRFSQLRRGGTAELPAEAKLVDDLREAVQEAREREDDEALFVIEDRAREHAERIEEKAGLAAAREFYAMATQPGRLTLSKAVKKMNDRADISGSTKQKRGQAVRELLRFLKVADCLPEAVTEDRAVAYVEWLNATSLGYSTKQDRLSTLQTIWRWLGQKRQVARGVNPWTDHDVTGHKRAGSRAEEGARVAVAKRGWKPAEIVQLFKAPDEARASHYSRSLFRELYCLGLTVGARLDEIVSLRPSAVEAIRGGYMLTIEASKTDAGVRTIPVVHKAAVAIIKRRLAAQKDPERSIFPECRPGGPDNKLSWHVQKAMGRDRDRLGFGPEVDFHSTRRSFLTMMENSGADVVHVQRYVGHRVPTMMHAVYSDGASRENLLKVARAVKYPAAVETVLAALSRTP